MLVIREMQIKTTRDHYPSFRMTESKEVNTKKKKKKEVNTKCWQRYRVIGTLLAGM